MSERSDEEREEARGSEPSAPAAGRGASRLSWAEACRDLERACSQSRAKRARGGAKTVVAGRAARGDETVVRSRLLCWLGKGWRVLAVTSTAHCPNGERRFERATAKLRVAVVVVVLIARRWGCAPRSPARLRAATTTRPTLAFVDPATRFRRALASCGPSSPSLEFLVRLADRVPTDGHVRYRNTDPQTRATSLHLAAGKGRLDLVRWLLDEGVDQAEVSRVRSPLTSPLPCAALSASRADPEPTRQDVLGDTVLHVAAAHGHVAILDAYLDRLPFVLSWVNSRGMTPLHVAAMKGELDAAHLLIDAGSDVDAPDLEGNSPLHFAASWGHVSVRRLRALLLLENAPADSRTCARRSSSCSSTAGATPTCATPTASRPPSSPTASACSRTSRPCVKPLPRL